MDQDYKEACARDAAQMEKDEKTARKFIKGVHNMAKEKIKNGTYPEQASLVVSIHCSNQ